MIKIRLTGHRSNANDDAGMVGMNSDYGFSYMRTATSLANDSGYAYMFTGRKRDINPRYGSPKALGAPVRCISEFKYEG